MLLLIFVCFDLLLEGLLAFHTWWRRDEIILYASLKTDSLVSAEIDATDSGWDDEVVLGVLGG